MSPAEKIRAVFEQNELLRACRKRANVSFILRPTIARSFLRADRASSGRETMRRVYGWDPDRASDRNPSGASKTRRCAQPSAIPYMVGVRLASSLHGIFRSTNDVDIVAEMREEHIASVSRIAGTFYAWHPGAMSEALHRGLGLQRDPFFKSGSKFGSAAGDSFIRNTTLALQDPGDRWEKE